MPPIRARAKRTRLLEDERGVSMVVVLVLTMLVLGMGAYGARNAQLELLIARNDVLGKKAFGYAEGGLNEGIALVKNDFTDGFDDELAGGGTGGGLGSLGTTIEYDGEPWRFRRLGPGARDGYYVRLRDNYDEGTDPNDSTDDRDSRVALQSVGIYNGAVRILESGVQPLSLFNNAVFGDDFVRLNSNAYTDSFDSEVGTYCGLGSVPTTGEDCTSWSCNAPGQNGDVGTNGTQSGALGLDSNAQIYGAGTVGYGGNPGTSIVELSNSEVHGTKDALDTPKDLPVISAPSAAGAIPLPGIHLTGDVANTYAFASGAYSLPEIYTTSNGPTTFQIVGDVTFHVGSVFLDTNAKVLFNLTGGATMTIVADTFEMLSNNELGFSGDGSMKIFVKQRMDINSNAIINNATQDATRFAIIGTETLTGNNMSFDSNAHYFGTIYAPAADITVDSNVMIFGAMIGNSIDFNSNGCLHYDERLGRTGDACCTITYWRELRRN